MKRVLSIVIALMLLIGLCACAGNKESDTASKADSKSETESESTTNSDSTEAIDIEINAFIAASLSTVMTEVAAEFNKENPNVRIVYNADSSGTLMNQIMEGYTCDIFFSAGKKQMDTLEEEGLLVPDTRANVVNNKLCVITRKDSGTEVTGLSDLNKAESIALADGSVPVGRYTRIALMASGILPETDDASAYTTKEVSDALGGVEISEQGNVSKVLMAVKEGSCEVGTTYYSDTYGYEDEIEILEEVSYDLSGNIIYPIALTVNNEQDEDQKKAVSDFLDFVLSDKAKAIFESYYFDTNV